MTCRDFTDVLVDYVAEELSATSRQTFEAHLAGCPNCRVFLAQYRHTIVVERLAMTSPDEDAATPIPDDLVRAIVKALEQD
ncbi:MAG TPA: zf-HC2 domain-containing protein [Vicinamibacterales bacterium]|nr:zf-HC2 domain-containing protein [Vicinamibacterales bacterium]